jgi:hypothetical protein
MTLAECLQVLLDLTEALEAALTRDDLPTCQRLAGDREAALEAFLGELRAAPDPLRLSMRGRLEELLRRDEALRTHFGQALADLGRQLEDLRGRSGSRSRAVDAPLCLDRKA